MPTAQYDLNEFLSSNLKYPMEARKKGIQGRVIIKFLVNEEGSISDIILLKGIGSSCDEEAERIVGLMPKWKPGKQNGKPVSVWFTLPINFKLQ